MVNFNELPLRDIHLPGMASWWPPAIGWWLLILLILIVIFAGVAIFKLCLKTTLKKEACKTLGQIAKVFQDDEDPARCISDLSKFLRRVLLSQKGAVKVAGVTGEAWLVLLDQPLKSKEFSEGVGRILLTGPYAPRVPPNDVAKLLQLCDRWVHKL